MPYHHPAKTVIKKNEGRCYGILGIILANYNLPFRVMSAGRLNHEDYYRRGR